MLRFPIWTWISPERKKDWKRKKIRISFILFEQFNLFHLTSFQNLKISLPNFNKLNETIVYIRSDIQVAMLTSQTYILPFINENCFVRSSLLHQRRLISCQMREPCWKKILHWRFVRYFFTQLYKVSALEILFPVHLQNCKTNVGFYRLCAFFFLMKLHFLYRLALYFTRIVVLLPFFSICLQRNDIKAYLITFRTFVCIHWCELFASAPENPKLVNLFDECVRTVA